MRQFLTKDQYNQLTKSESWDSAVANKVAIEDGQTPDDLFNKVLYDLENVLVGITGTAWLKLDFPEQIPAKDLDLLNRIALLWLEEFTVNPTLTSKVTSTSPDGYSITKDNDEDYTNFVPQKILILIQKLTWYQDFIEDEEVLEISLPDIGDSIPDTFVRLTNPAIPSGIITLFDYESSIEERFSLLNQEIAQLEADILFTKERLDDFANSGLTIEENFANLQQINEDQNLIIAINTAKTLSNSNKIDAIEDELVSIVSINRGIQELTTVLGEVVIANWDFFGSPFGFFPGSEIINQDFVELDKVAGTFKILFEGTILNVSILDTYRNNQSLSSYNASFRLRKMIGATPNPATDPIWPNQQQGEVVKGVDLANTGSTVDIDFNINYTFELADLNQIFYVTIENNTAGVDVFGRFVLNFADGNKSFEIGIINDVDVLNTSTNIPGQNQLIVNESLDARSKLNETEIIKLNKSEDLIDFEEMNDPPLNRRYPLFFKLPFLGTQPITVIGVPYSEINTIKVTDHMNISENGIETYSYNQTNQKKIGTGVSSNSAGASLNIYYEDSNNIRRTTLNISTRISDYKSKINGLDTDLIDFDKDAVNKEYADALIPNIAKTLIDLNILEKNQEDLFLKIFKENFKNYLNDKIKKRSVFKC